jgi:hypothetical protein
VLTPVANGIAAGEEINVDESLEAEGVSFGTLFATNENPVDVSGTAVGAFSALVELFMKENPFVDGGAGVSSVLLLSLFIKENPPVLAANGELRPLEGSLFALVSDSILDDIKLNELVADGWASGFGAASVAGGF